MGGLRPRPSEGRTSKFGSESLDGISSVPHPVVEVEDVAADGIWLHEAWANDGRQTYNICLSKSKCHILLIVYRTLVRCFS
jgi:hypothetical protein